MNNNRTISPYRAEQGRSLFSLAPLVVQLAILVGALSAGTAWGEDWMYRVRPGDNLWSFSETYLTDSSLWRKVQELNHIADPWRIPPGTALYVPAQWLKKFPVSARVVHIQGNVLIFDHVNRSWSVALEGSLLARDDQIKTDENASVTVEFIDGSQLVLQPGGLLKLNSLGRFGDTGMTDTRLLLEEGRLETKVTPRKGSATRFEISTPAAVTSVRGTDYRVSADQDGQSSRAEVVEGKVAVNGSGRGRLVPEGYGTVVAEGRPPIKPVELAPPPNLRALPEVFDRVPIQFPLPSLEDGTTGYRAQIAADEGFEKLLFDRLYTTQVARGPDLPDGHYFLRVRAVGEGGLEGLDASRPFTLNARPEPPFAVEPKPDAGVVEESPSFEWAKQPEIERYHVQVARNGRFEFPVVDLTDVTDNHVTIEPKLSLGKYAWRVAAIDAQEGEGPFSDPQPFRRVTAPPTVEEPEFGDANFLVRWRAGLPGQQFDVQFADEPTFAKPLLEAHAAEPKLEIPSPEPGEYFLRIRTIDPDGFKGPFGPPQSIEVPGNDYYWFLMALPLLALIAI